ncbi:MAG: hypothetical protein D3915_11390 [Candidatus Electrothrix sp. AU1_5]|nr:hypothetical protein [Candidatus Electrothrix gigas]
MFNKDYADEDYTDILKRINSRKSYSPHDIEALSRQITVSWNGNAIFMQIGGQNIYGSGNVVQNGGQNIYIPNNSGNIHIGNNIVIQGLTADALNKAIAAALQKLNIGIPNQQAQDDGLVSFKWYFLFIWMLTSLLLTFIFVYFSIKNNYLYISPSVSIYQFILWTSGKLFVNQLIFGGVKFIYEMRHNEFQYRRVKHSYFHWTIYPIVIILEFMFFIIKIMTKLVFQSMNSNLFKPFKWP